MEDAINLRNLSSLSLRDREDDDDVLDDDDEVRLFLLGRKKKSCVSRT